MANVFRFDSGSETFDGDIPSRDTLITNDSNMYIVDDVYYTPVFPTDVVELSKSRTFCGNKCISTGVKCRGHPYTLMLFCTLMNGERCTLALVDIPIILHVLIKSELSSHNIYKLLDDNNIMYYRDKSTYVRGYQCHGFHKDSDLFLQLIFQTSKNKSDAISLLQNNGYGTFTDVAGSQLSTVLLHNDLSISDWCVITDYVENDDIWYVHYKNYHPISIPLSNEISDKRDFINQIRPYIPASPKLLTWSWDIEAYSSTGRMTNAEIKDDVITMIGIGISYYTEKEPALTFVITSVDISDEWMDKNTDIILIVSEDEKGILLAMAKLFSHFLPEFTLAFNNYNFDDKYIHSRALYHKVFDRMINMMSPIPIQSYRAHFYNYTMFYREAHLKTEANTSVERYYIYVPGTVNIDMMHNMMKNNPKDELLESNALSSYLKRYNLPPKMDIEIYQMFQNWRTLDTKGIAYDALYCGTDAISCQRLQAVVGTIGAALALSHLSFCAPRDSVIKADSAKVKNNIYYKGKAMGVFYTERQLNSTSESYPGAYVFEPATGIHKDIPTFVLDFASLYPSIMIALNMSSETFVSDESTAKQLIDEGYDLYEFTFPLENVDRYVAFVREHPDKSHYIGVYRNCLLFYADQRNMYKKELAKAKEALAATDPEMIDDYKAAELKVKKYNNNQGATKILMNTFYGLLGNAMFPLYNVYIAAAITMFGRECLNIAATIAKDNNHTLIYGDTDSIFIKPNIDTSDTITMLKESVAISNTLLTEINKAVSEYSRASALKMAFDKLLFPLVMLGKKMYYASAWDSKSFTKYDELYISGVVSVKRGKTKILKDTFERVITKSLDMDIRDNMLNIVVNILNELVETIYDYDISMFSRVAKCNAGKESFINTFIERMRREYDRAVQFNNETDINLYEPPNFGTKFEYVVCKPLDKCSTYGYVQSWGMSDKMEFVKVALTYNRKLDYMYYFEDIIGSIARFIIPELDICKTLETDKEKQSAADKYLRDLFSSYQKELTISAPSIKKKRKDINEKYRAKMGEIIMDNLVILFNNGNQPDSNIIEIIMSNIYNNVPYDQIQLDKSFNHTREKMNISDIETSLKLMNEDVVRIYEEYIYDLKEVCAQKKITDTYKLFINIEDDISDITKYEDLKTLLNKLNTAYTKIRAYEQCHNTDVDTITDESDIKRQVREIIDMFI